MHRALRLMSLLLAFGASGAAACSCSFDLPLEERLRREFAANPIVVLVEVGRPTRVSVATEKRYTSELKVLESFKGSVVVGDSLPITFVDSADTCSSFVWEGDLLLLYLEQPEVTEYDFGGCRVSGTVPEREAPDVLELRRLASEIEQHES